MPVTAPRRRHVLAAIALVTVACSGEKEAPAPVVEAAPAPVETIEVHRVPEDVAALEGDAAYWRSVPRGVVTLLAQPMINPRPEKTNTEQVVVQAVHNGTDIAFRLSWADPEPSEAGRLGQFSDALALEFPIKEATRTPVMMGAKDYPVHIFHWRAQYQRDKEHGKPQMTSLYPNMAVDMYAMDFKEAPGGTDSEKESFSPGRAERNPQSFPKTGVDEVVAEGFSTSTVQRGHSGEARGTWKDGRWTLVLTRPLAIEGGSVLEPGTTGSIAFAAWQGGLGEVGSRKSVNMSWIPLEVAR